jgi:hypothetical protein
MFSARNKEKIELLQDCLKHKKRRKSDEINYTTLGRRQMWRRGANTGQKLILSALSRRGAIQYCAGAQGKAAPGRSAQARTRNLVL